MALTVNTDFPLRIHLADEDAVLKLSAYPYIKTAGAYSVLTLIFDDLSLVNETCSLTIGGNNYDHKINSPALGDGHDWPLVATSLADYMTALKNYLKTLYYISKDYDVYSGANWVSINAKYKGSEYDITFDEGTLTGFVSATVSPAGALREYYDFHTVRMNILWYNKTMGSAAALALTEIERPLDPSGQVKFNLKGLSKGLHETGFEWHEYLLLIPRSDMQVKLSLTFSEHHGTPPIPYSPITTKLLTTIAGGLSREKLAEINEGGSHPIPLNATYPRVAMTNHPGNKKVFYDSVEKLFFDFFTTPFFSSIRSKIKIQRKTGGYLTFYRSTFVNSGEHTVFEVSASPYTNNLYQINLDEILYYEITLVDQNGDAITETRRFYLDMTYYPNKRRFIFLNSLGRYDGITCTGEWSNTNEYESDEFVQLVDETFTSDDAEIATLDVTEHQTFECSTGWIDLETNDWLRDFSLSKERHEIDDYGRRYRIYITSKKIFKHRTKEYLYKMDFEYVRAYKDKFYSRLAIPAEHGTNHENYPRYVNENITPVLGMIYDDSDAFLSVHWDEVPMELGMRVLVLNQATRMGEIYVCTEGEPNTLELTGEDCPGNRVYDQQNDVVYQRNSEGEWLTGAYITGLSEAGENYTVDGLTLDNVVTELWTCDTVDGDFVKIAEESDPDIFREDGITVLGSSVLQYIQLRLVHCVFDFPVLESQRTFSQSFSLVAGWQIISIYVQPDDPDMVSIFSDIAGDIELVKDENNDTYTPGGANNIGNWLITKAYNIKAYRSTSLVISGTKIIPENNPISLSSAINPNFVAYLRDSAMSIEDICADIVDNISVVKDSNGDTYWPSIHINTIGNMLPGQGYKFTMTGDDTLIYPEN